jgi:hypothetical protein
MNKWIDLSRIGKEKEIEFSELLLSEYGGEVLKSSKEDDMYNHIDIIWTYKNNSYSFDIKGAKKASRSDYVPDYNIHWIELQNVRGNLGWLYGKADYIAFETLDDWLVVKRTDIINLIDKKVIDKLISKSKNFYTYYQRDNRQDIVVKVPTDDLRRIARKILLKKVH